MKNNDTQLRFLPCGDSAVTVEFSKEMSEQVNRQIRYVASALTEGGVKGISECVPTFCSLTVYYDPFQISAKKIQRKIASVKLIFYNSICVAHIEQYISSSIFYRKYSISRPR